MNDDSRIVFAEMTLMAAEGVGITWDSLLIRLETTQGKAKAYEIFKTATQSGTKVGC